MTSKLPRIRKVEAKPERQVFVSWSSRETDTIDLSGWIATGNEGLAPLKDPEVFRLVAVGAHGSNLTWDDDEGDLAIDAMHLLMLAREQRPFGAAQVTECQAELGISNTEAAGLFGVSASTWATYKNGSAVVPPVVAIACRSAMRDPIVLQAHLKPARAPGRPTVRRDADTGKRSLRS